MSLSDSVIRGLKERAQEAVRELLEKRDALTIINEEMIPALDVVGKGFEKGTVFLPQLLMSAEAAKAAFEVIKDKMSASGQTAEKKGTVILATVKGDIHDIGKNIVKVLLENYSFDIIDLGKDVPPEKIVEMYHLWEQGYEVVEGVKTDRGEESPFHAFAARCFYDLISKAVGIDMSSASDFKLLDRKAINALLTIREKNVFFRALSFWVGFKTTTVEFEVRERTAGSSKWSTRSLMRYAVNNITSFSAAPMQVVTVLGVLMLLISVILGVTTLVQKLRGTALGGFTTVIIIQLFTGSIIMISLGIIGYYIAKMYEEVKGRPKFIVAETCGEKNDAESLIG